MILKKKLRNTSIIINNIINPYIAINLYVFLFLFTNMADNNAGNTPNIILRIILADMPVTTMAK